MFKRMLAVAQRVLRQLARDRRFLVLSLGAPMAAIYISKAALDAFDIPFIDCSVADECREESRHCTLKRAPRESREFCLVWLFEQAVEDGACVGGALRLRYVRRG